MAGRKGWRDTFTRPHIFDGRKRRERADKNPRRSSREDAQNFEKRANRSYLPGPKGEAMRKKHAKRRAAAKRAKQARKVNRA